jgi:hypothetical protein
MNKEDYVSLEVARLLEEKGCNLSSDRCYIGGRFTESDFTEDCDDVYYSAPTLYEAQKWLRKRGYHVEVVIYGKREWGFIIYGFDEEMCINIVILENQYTSFEEALNAGILEALKLI